MPTPNFFILGARKCGTTALSEYLRTHPNIFFSDPKELWYFDSDLRHRSRPSSREAYLAFFRKANPGVHLAIGEGSPSYIYSRTAVPEILKLNPEARFIVALRSPIDFAASWHGQLLRQGIENIRDFREAWAAQEDRKQGGKIPLGCSEPKVLCYSDMALFGDQVERLYSSVRPEKVKIILFNNLVADPARVYAEILGFLGLPHDGRKHFPRINEARRVHSIPLQRALFHLFRPWAYLSHRWGIPLDLGLGAWLSSRNAAPSPRVPLPPDFHAELARHFRPDVEKLGRLLGKNLSGWLSMDPIPKA